ncbi:branched-chain-amino-acid aminotransferase-like protein 2 [Bidens hawaiensis]|uniref:branched-chain-amino-acid aminotransferase-like protein 2 n=1 Tax=Bidens hawaiensis TaxID=980011 RepID=UPI00404A72C6
MGEEIEKEVEVIHSWSAPRSLSTSLMYSFAQRDDTEVLDEPLYAHFLKVTDVDRPCREDVLSKMESDGNKVVNNIIYGPGEKKYRYCKHISKQRLPGLSDELIKKGKHFILIRNPLDILAALRGLCEDLEIPFQASMLKWEAGPKSVDGAWAPWWYKSVHKSTGFSRVVNYPHAFPGSLYELLEQSLPFYNMLRCHARQKRFPKLPMPSLPVPANEKILVWVGDELLTRDSAAVSVFDSVVQGGDSVWEGLRIYNGKVFKLEEHLYRLFDSAKALAFNNVPTRDYVKEAIFKTLTRNGMFVTPGNFLNPIN